MHAYEDTISLLVHGIMSRSSRFYLYAMIIPVLVQGVFAQLHQGVGVQLGVFSRHYGVPDEVYLGLLSKQKKVEKVSLVNGTCFDYNPAVLRDRCKFYSDCCAMAPSRPMEQLAPGTFSCHSGFYIVDKCPAATTDDELKELCEGMSYSGSFFNLFSENFTVIAVCGDTHWGVYQRSIE